MGGETTGETKSAAVGDHTRSVSEGRKLHRGRKRNVIFRFLNVTSLSCNHPKERGQCGGRHEHKGGKYCMLQKIATVLKNNNKHRLLFIFLCIMVFQTTSTLAC